MENLKRMQKQSKHIAAYTPQTRVLPFVLNITIKSNAIFIHCLLNCVLSEPHIFLLHATQDSVNPRSIPCLSDASFSDPGVPISTFILQTEAAPHL